MCVLGRIVLGGCVVLFLFSIIFFCVVFCFGLGLVMCLEMLVGR